MGKWIVEPLKKAHERVGFDSGHALLDNFMMKYASQYARRKLGTTYVAIEQGDPRVRGYYTLAPSHFDYAEAPTGVVKGLPKHPVPSLLLARLAVTKSEQGKGLGKYLLVDAFTRCVRVAREAAFRGLEVEAIDDQAASFYAKFGFLAFPSNPRHLVLPFETIERALGP